VPDVNTVRPIDAESRAALDYVSARRRGTDRPATWFDVAKAYYDAARKYKQAEGSD